MITATVDENRGVRMKLLHMSLISCFKRPSHVDINGSYLPRGVSATLDSPDEPAKRTDGT